MPNRTIDVYAAGLIDGEGCIGIHSQKDRHFTLRVDVGMTVKARSVLDQMQAEYGGKVVHYRDATERWEAACAWRVMGAEAVTLLTRIRPHLRLKAEQAQIGLKLEEIRHSLIPKGKTNAVWTDADRDRCRTLKRRMNELNMKGPSIPSQANGKMFARLVAGTWVTDQADLFSDLGWQPFSGSWPKSGTWDLSAAYELPTSTPRTSGPGSLSSPDPLLPTPRTSDTNGPGQHGDGGLDLRTAVTLLPTPTAVRYGNNQSPSPGAAVRPSLDELVKLLPTPRASDGAKGGPNQRGSSGDLMLPSAVMLLPTPTARDFKDGETFNPHPEKSKLPHTIAAMFRTGPDMPPPSSGGNTSPDDESSPHCSRQARRAAVVGPFRGVADGPARRVGHGCSRLVAE